jgi:hypothetical protein
VIDIKLLMPIPGDQCPYYCATQPLWWILLKGCWCDGW